MRRNEDAGAPALIASDGAERSHANETQTAPASLKALCAIAAFHQIAAEPANLAHQLGLTPSEPIGKDSSALSFLGSSPYGNAYLIEATSEPSQDKDKHSVGPTRLAAHAGEAAPEHSSSTPVRCEDVFDLSQYGCDGLEMDAGVVRPQRQLLKLWD